MADALGNLRIVAVDMGGTNVRVALVDGRGTILDRVVEHTQSEQGADRVADRISANAKALLTKNGVAKAAGVGAALAGPIDRDGVLFDPPNLIGWKTVPFKALLQSRFDIPVWVGNDANVAAIGERVFGQGRGLDDLIYMTVSTGVGGGVISGGHLVNGWRGMGAEVGHIIIDLNGPTGRCGHKGCLESHISGTAIAARAQAAIMAGRSGALSQSAGGTAPNAGQVFAAAAAGDGLARELVGSVARELAAGIVSLVHVFNPKMMILGGAVVAANWGVLEAPVRESVAKGAFQAFLPDLQITITTFGDDVGLLGAAALVVQETQGAH